MAQEQGKAIDMRPKDTFDKGAKKTKSTKRSIASSISSTDLTKLKSLKKCNNQPEVPLDQKVPTKTSPTRTTTLALRTNKTMSTS